MSEPVDRAWYIYAVLDEAVSLDQMEGILPGSAVDAVPLGGLWVLASLVPRALFDQADAGNRTADPDWIAERAASHHRVNSAAAAAASSLPLTFATLFSSLDLVEAWLLPRRDSLCAALAAMAGQTEWLLCLTENAAAHTAWLGQHDPELQRLGDAAAKAGAGTGFLMARRLEKARVAARGGHVQMLETSVYASLAQTSRHVLTERRRDGLPAWSILAPRDLVQSDITGSSLAALEATLAPMGLGLRITGPWPAYAFAKTVMAGEAAHV
jgi:hypothetical protein